MAIFEAIMTILYTIGWLAIGLGVLLAGVGICVVAVLSVFSDEDLDMYGVIRPTIDIRAPVHSDSIELKMDREAFEKMYNEMINVVD